MTVGGAPPEGMRIFWVVIEGGTAGGGVAAGALLDSHCSHSLSERQAVSSAVTRCVVPLASNISSMRPPLSAGLRSMYDIARRRISL